MSWPLPPQLPWPRFLRLLRQPAPPRGWLEAASEIPDIQRRPLLLRWIAQHPQAPAHLRARLLPRLPWRALAAIAADAAAHPQARVHAVERLRGLWPGLTTGERRSLALLAPRPLWSLVWKVRSRDVLLSFLQNPRLGLEQLVALIQAPLSPAHLAALEGSLWRERIPVAHQVIAALDGTLDLPDSGVVLGMAAPWLIALPPEERLLASCRVTHPVLRRMARTGSRPVPGSGDAEVSL